MTDRLDHLEGRLDELVTAIAGIERRLDALEAQRGSAVPAADAESAPPGGEVLETAAVKTSTVAGVLPTLGRAFLVLCGAFLLRSLTDAGILPQALGIALGFAYAALWVVLADRAGAAGRTLAANLSGGVASIIAYPLLWEATRRFVLLSVDQAVAGLALFSGLALVVTWRRKLRALAWVVTVAALTTDLALMVAHRSWGPPSAVVLALAATSVWCAYLRGWPGLRWPVALVANLLPMMMISDAIRGLDPGIPDGPSAASVLLVTAVFIAVYLGSFALAMLGMRRRVGVFEIVQGLAVLVAGFAAAHHYLNALAMDDRAFGVLTLLVGLVCYAIAFVFVDRSAGRSGNFLYFSSLALVLGIGGIASATEGPLRVAALSAFGVAAAVLGARFDRITLRSHSAAFIVAAAVIGGPALHFAAAFVAPPAAVPHLPTPADLLVIGAALACSFSFAAGRSRRSRAWPTLIPDFIVAATWLAGIGAVGLMVFAGLASARGPLAPGLLAAVRSLVLALAAMVAAGLSSLRDGRALRWLVYPALVLCGLKLVIEDLRLGSPAMLFISFAAFGIALIVAPRLLRSAQRHENLAAGAPSEEA